MGLLDDAIREHLDLKRRRGADPTEVERAEREALGPVRRGPESQAPIEEPQQEVADEVGYAPPEDTAWNELMAQNEHQHGDAPAVEFAAHDEFEDEFEALAEHEHADVHEPQIERTPPRPVVESTLAAPSAADDEPATAEFFEPVPPPAQPQPQPTGSPSVAEPHGETVEYDVERAMGAEEHDPAEQHDPAEHHEPAERSAPAGEQAPAQEQGHSEREEDPLEETPEFLQDTPDHDRLWFEQRPPRDFDFDG
ncbi:MAG: hypothetical protein ACYDHH_29650 [Solirubrobacteraceae bacterium]